MLRILYDDFDQKCKNIHDEMNLYHSYIKKKRSVYTLGKLGSLDSETHITNHEVIVS